MIGLKDGHSCNNKTWVMGYIILATHCAEIVLGLIFALCIAACSAYPAAVMTFIKVFTILWGL